MDAGYPNWGNESITSSTLSIRYIGSMAYGKKPGALANAVVAILRDEYKRQGISQTKLAELSGISQSQVSRIFLGMRALDVDQLQGMCDALNLKFRDVLQQAEERIE